MVAAAKLRRAQEAVIAARPYAQKLEGMVQQLVARVEQRRASAPARPETESRTLVDRRHRRPRPLRRLQREPAAAWRSVPRRADRRDRSSCSIGRKGTTTSGAADVTRASTSRRRPATLRPPWLATSPLAHRARFIDDEVDARLPGLQPRSSPRCRRFRRSSSLLPFEAPRRTRTSRARIPLRAESRGDPRHAPAAAARGAHLARAARVDRQRAGGAHDRDGQRDAQRVAR